MTYDQYKPMPRYPMKPDITTSPAMDHKQQENFLLAQTIQEAYDAGAMKQISKMSVEELTHHRDELQSRTFRTHVTDKMIEIFNKEFAIKIGAYNLIFGEHAKH